MNALLEAAAAAVAEGVTPEWHRLQAELRTPEERVALEGLRVIARVAGLWQETAHSLTADDASLAVPTRWGVLDVTALIARGSFGDVYRARDPRIDREVALKVLRRSTPSARAVIEEARLLARVRHPHIVTVFGADVVNGRAGFWMELVPGESLADRIARLGASAPLEAVTIARDLARAVEAVHAAGLLHRDIKAQNVVCGEDGAVRLADFGAGCERDDAAQAGVLVGTPLYLAPEVIDGQAPDERTDVYALGVLLFHLLTGSWPVAGRTVQEVLDAHRRRAARTLREIRPELPASLARIVDAALAPSPERRTASAGAFAAALDAWLVGHGRGWHRPLAAAAVIAAVAVSAILWLGRNQSDPPAHPATMTARRLPVTVAPNGAVSPDGRWLSHVDADGGLALLDLHTAVVRRLTGPAPAGRASFSSFSPDGRRVAVTWRESGGGSALYVASVDSGAPRLLHDPGRDFDIRPYAWSPDGRDIAVVVTDPDQQAALLTIDARTGAGTRLATLGWRRPVAVAFSADTRWLFWDTPVVQGDPARDIVALDRRTHREHVVVGGTANDYSPWLTPDGRLFFLSDRARTTAGWLLGVADGRGVREPQLAVRDLGPFRSRILGVTTDGRLVYGMQNGLVDVHVAGLDPRTRLASPPLPVDQRGRGANISPDWSPDGTMLAHVADRGVVPDDVQSRSLAVRLPDGSVRHLSPPLGFFTQPRLSPDGRSVLLKGRDSNGTWGLHQVSLDAGRVSRSFLEGQAFGNVGWVDDRRVLYTLDGAIWQLDVPTGTSRRLCSVAPSGQQLATGLAISRDGSQAAVSHHDPAARAWRSVVVSLDSCATRHLLTAHAPDGAVVEAWWTSASGFIVSRWRDRAEGGYENERLAYLSQDGRTLHDLGIASPGIRDVRLRADQEQIAFTAGQPTWEIWMLEHFLPDPQP